MTIKKRFSIPKGVYVISKKNGKKFTTPFVFTSDGISNIRKNSSEKEKYTVVSPITMRQYSFKGKMSDKKRK